MIPQPAQLGNVDHCVSNSEAATGPGALFEAFHPADHDVWPQTPAVEAHVLDVPPPDEPDCGPRANPTRNLRSETCHDCPVCPPGLAAGGAFVTSALCHGRCAPESAGRAQSPTDRCEPPGFARRLG